MATQDPLGGQAVVRDRPVEKFGEAIIGSPPQEHRRGPEALHAESDVGGGTTGHGPIGRRVVPGDEINDAFAKNRDGRSVHGADRTGGASS